MNQLWKSVQQLHLKSVRTRFAAKKGWWWQLSHSTAQIEREYRQFLYLSAGRSDKSLIPWSKDIDAFWHEHCSDSKKYAHDCEAVLGKAMPYQKRFAEGSTAHRAAISETRRLYLTSFGESARKKRRAGSDIDFDRQMPQVFSDHDHHIGHHHHSGHHGWGHHGGHQDAGHHAGANHGGGGHAGHSCGGHSSCGGHGGH